MPLTPFFSPRGVAVIGASATPGKLGYGVVRNLLQYGYQGGVYPVNPRVEAILGRPCYPDIASVPDPVDLAVIIIPAAAVAAVLQNCARRGIRAVTILSAVLPKPVAREQNDRPRSSPSPGRTTSLHRPQLRGGFGYIQRIEHHLYRTDA